MTELAPGDALYIPYGWWHGVQSLEPVSALVNYWWSDADLALAGAYDGLLHAIAAFRHLPPEQRKVWQHMVDHYVFEKNGPPAEHLPRTRAVCSAMASRRCLRGCGRCCGRWCVNGWV